MSDIAVEAGVAVQTVYFSFHNKPALMRAPGLRTLFENASDLRLRAGKAGSIRSRTVTR
jgi:hypothetical protein